ncbi:MAG: hypothetical protein FJ030_12290 [Chloroflexi bacterium]|nr:hypothetical protein [Chloroflexota bacterium]
MTPRKILITAIVLASITAACRPGRFRITAPPPPPDSAEPTRALASTLPPSQTPAPRTPAPTFDFPSYLLTQAYANHTPQATATALPQPSSTLHPPPDEDENSILFVGKVAEFQAGLDNAQPGQYTARLVMCPLNVAECNEGKGWQNVGGDSINFVITP